jgi:hypothetical protein
VILRLSTGEVPPTLELEEPQELNSLGVVVEITSHAWIARSELIRLAGDNAHDAEWLEKLDAMLGFAAKRGWTDAAGRVRAHVELAAP